MDEKEIYIHCDTASDLTMFLWMLYIHCDTAAGYWIILPFREHKTAAGTNPAEIRSALLLVFHGYRTFEVHTVCIGRLG